MLNFAVSKMKQGEALEHGFAFLLNFLPKRKRSKGEGFKIKRGQGGKGSMLLSNAEVSVRYETGCACYLS